MRLFLWIRTSAIGQLWLAGVLCSVGAHVVHYAPKPYALYSLPLFWFGLRAAKRAGQFVCVRYHVTFPPLFRRG